jgi:hypothetical protein
MAGAHEQQPTGLGERHGGATEPARWCGGRSRPQRFGPLHGGASEAARLVIQVRPGIQTRALGGDCRESVPLRRQQKVRGPLRNL